MYGCLTCLAAFRQADNEEYIPPSIHRCSLRPALFGFEGLLVFSTVLGFPRLLFKFSLFMMASRLQFDGHKTFQLHYNFQLDFRFEGRSGSFHRK